MIEKLQEGIAKDENSASGSTTEQTKTNDASPEANAIDLSPNEEAEGVADLKRKSSSPSLSAEQENTEISKKRKVDTVDDGNESEASMEKACDNNASPSSPLNLQ